jgi:ribosomal protein S18 acetylase RimI-like enzyme/glycosyltransferase involved in cell wall biosynthesis
MKDRIKRWLFALLGKDPEAIIVSFRSGDKALADAMCQEIKRLEPSRRHFSVDLGESRRTMRIRLRRYRIGLAPVLFNGDARYRSVRRSAFLLAPTKILAYNARLERHHLKWTQPVASGLFLRGVPLDRIFLRPRWLCPWRSERTTRPSGHRTIEGRPRHPKRRSIAVLTPYFPYPLSHGGAVRMFNLLRETAREFDVVLYSFTEGEIPDADLQPVLEFATRIYLVRKPRYREPRWSTIAPPEVGEYESPAMAALVHARDADLLQVEYTCLASYGGDILVEHDVTFDLYAQVRARRPTLAAWWDWWRWRRFEGRAVARFRRVVVMSEKDRALLGAGHARVIENGVDLERFQPQSEPKSRRLLFIGSFRHFPNIVAFRFLTEKILPLVPDVEVTIVAGPEPWLHWSNHTGAARPPANPRVRLLEFVSDVRPLYHETNVVAVPTLESAGTNVKVLEAMAMERAVIATASGCQGFGLEHGKTVWIADTAGDFAAGIRTLLEDDGLRSRIARAGRTHVEAHFDWRSIGRRQRALLRELRGDPLTLRPATRDDLPAITAIQAASTTASQWAPETYLDYDCRVAESDGSIAGFLVARQTAPGEREILNMAVNPYCRRLGIARRLIESELERSRGAWFLEVRESNAAAISFYKSLGFLAVGRREAYYPDSPQAAIVMRIFS